MIQDKKLSIYLMIMQELNLNLFMKQNKMKQNEMKQNREQQDLKDQLLDKCFKDYQQLLHN